MTKSFIVAIDGPAASGKGTLARRIAIHYGIPHLDTGLTYRAVAKDLLDKALPLDNESIAAKAALHLDLQAMDKAVLSAHEIGEAASKVAVMPDVRRALVEAQRNFANALPASVLDGRDIGTVVCPEAEIKLFVTASAQVRAQRRYDEIIGKGGAADFAAILADLQKRDARDMNRSDSPLKPAQDAHLLDTSEMSIEAAFLAAKTLIDQALSRHNA